MGAIRIMAAAISATDPSNGASALRERQYAAHAADGQRLALTGIQLLGLYGGLEPESSYAPLKGRLERSYLQAVSSTIAAGTSEVQRGIIATRGLGLPRG